MKKNKRKPKYNYGRILDLILFLIFPLVSVLFLLTIKKFTTKFSIILGIILLIIYIICILTAFLKHKKVIHYIRRISLIILCLCIGYGFTYANSIASSFSNITNNSVHSTTKVTMDVLVLKESNINNIDDLSDKIFAVESASNKDNSEYVVEQIEKSLNDDIKSLSYSDYETMYSDYYNGYVDAIIVNESEKDSLSEDFASLYDDSKVIKSYTRTIQNTYSGNDIDITDNVFTVLLSATDETGAPASNSLSDMNMLLLINPNNNTVKTISIPRDSYIPNPAYNNISDKLTHTGNNGIENTVKAVEQAFQIDIDFYAKISFDSLIKIVDTLGGIDVDVLISFCEQDENRSFATEDEICLNAGTQTLNGKEALAYSRHRHSYTNQDLGRNDAQLRVIKGIINKILTADGINKIDDILDILPTYVITNFSDSQLSSFIKKQVDNLSGWSITSMSLTNGENGMGITASVPDQELAVYYLSETDIKNVNGAYNMIKEKPNMAKFTYNPSNSYHEYSTYSNSNNVITVE